MTENAITNPPRHRPERRFAGGYESHAEAEAGPGRFAGSAPIVLPERAKPRPAATPTRAELEDLGRRTASAAHDFNNLLSVIMVCAGEIVHGPDDGSFRERAAEIREAAERGAELSRRLLAGNGRVGRPEDDPGPQATGTAIIGAMKLLERTAGPGIQVGLVSDGHLPRVRLAPGELERILLNLAANSRDAMPHGGSIQVRTAVVSIPPGDPYLGTGWHLRIAFADDGAGMTPEVAQRAVEPYFSTKGNGEGTGLGLASVLALVRGAGGDLRINSRVGSGTTISVYLAALDGKGEPLALPGRLVR
jgi:signal transduction histidine kinase